MDERFAFWRNLNYFVEVIGFLRGALLILLFGGVGQAQVTPVSAEPGEGLEDLGSGPRLASEGSILNRKNARTITLEIPAPRGQIVDRAGKSLASNEVAYQVALEFEQFQDVDREYVVKWARTRMDQVKDLVEIPYEKTDDELYSHYRNRRWLPLYVSSQVRQKAAKELESKLMSGLTLYPVYRRTYPEGSLAAHVIGYSGSVGELPRGPINHAEPLWEEIEGRSGLEKLYNEELAGENGVKRLLFDENGNKLQEEQVKRPRPGGTVVTTINLKWQRLAERVLRKGCRKGAFVVIDVITGEVLVLASRPSFDLNLFTPGISTEDFKALQEDETNPLFGRAFQSAYPPASAFKPVVALAALNAGEVTEYSTIYCPASIKIGNHTFRNWSRVPEGSINVKRAIARSTNPWFYQVGIDVGPSVFLGLAKRLGMGEKTGLPLMGETRGLIPTNEWMIENAGRRIMDGDTANLSIGQGSMLASPLQVAQMMAGIGNGGALPKLSLITQVQDTRGRVVEAMIPKRKNWLGVDEKSVEVVREGMRDVVSKGYGTGKRASLTYTTIAAKTGTAQWGPKRLNQRLAWFAGFLPYDHPRYAFAVLYEGRPGQSVSGGRMAAPMVRNFFEPLKSEIRKKLAPPKRALVVVPEEEEAEVLEDEDEDEDEILRAIPIDDSQFEDAERAIPVPEVPEEGEFEGGFADGEFEEEE